MDRNSGGVTSSIIFLALGGWLALILIGTQGDFQHPGVKALTPIVLFVGALLALGRLWDAFQASKSHAENDRVGYRLGSPRDDSPTHLADLEDRIGELESRIDFTERMMARQSRSDRRTPPAGISS